MLTIDDQKIGIHQCELNAHESHIEAAKLLREGNYRHSAFFSIIAIEEVGKALFLLDSLEKGKSITEKEWKNRNMFYGHLPKMQKARDHFETRTQNELAQLLGIPPRAFVFLDFSTQDIVNLWFTRNRLLFVNYNFEQKKWEHPQQLKEELEAIASENLSKAISVFSSLEDILHEKGFDTFKIVRV